MIDDTHPPVCDYEGSDYQTRFWDKGGRAYEDGCEAIALKRLLPPRGNILLEVGAGAGRNTLRYTGYEHVVLLDYSRTQLQQAREKLGNVNRYTFVVADIYHIPFIKHVFETATMIRVLHHMVDAPEALRQVRDTLQPGAAFILEYANKRNIKAILRYVLRKQEWNPFAVAPLEFAPLNYNFHPNSVTAWMNNLGFHTEQVLSVSHFRINFLKKHIPLGILLGAESLVQWTGKIFLGTPSIFIRARLKGKKLNLKGEADPEKFFKCPNCSYSPLVKSASHLYCKSCATKWPIEDGMYIFKF